MLSMSVIGEREGGFSNLHWFNHRGSAVRYEKEREGLLIDKYLLTSNATDIASLTFSLNCPY